MFVRVLDGSTRCLHFDRDTAGSDEHAVTLGDLRRRLEDLEGVPAAEQLISCGSRVFGAGGRDGEASNDHLILGPPDAHGHLPSCALLLGLAGGKGGFGALLRGAANSSGTTTNFDACRDLSGRRLRHVNGEKKIIEFAKHAADRELEAVALAHINRRDNQVKRRFEAIEEEEKARYKEETRAAIENVTEAVSGGLAAVARTDEAARLRAADERAREAQAMRRIDGRWGLGGNSDDSDSDLDEETLVKAGLMPAIKRARGPGSASGSGSRERVDEQVRYAGKGKEPVGTVERPVTPPEEEPAKGAAKAVAEKKDEAAAGLPRDIVLKDYACPVDLEVFGLDRLKQELTARGLKCGGALRERAERLFLLRDKTLDQLDKKHLAKK